MRFTADGSQQIGIGRIEVVFVRIGVRQDPGRASAVLADRAEKVGALFGERELRFVGSGPDLMDGDIGHDLVWSDNSYERIQFVSELTVFADGIDRHFRFVATTLDAEVELVVVLPAHGFAHKLRPELGIALPLEPIHRPAVLQIGCERHCFTQAVLPTCEDGILAGGFEQNFRGIFGFRRDIAQQVRSGLEIDALERLDVFLHHRFE